ncbi:MAG: site-2 protease family protein [Armatimonadetes bacterium]|jgi:Zn-dependent protease|nr:site-2 protease family protein [Armatimonadota bacterium]MDI9586406.1 site-2 protease family protein [Acidobacteriota bacterium]
MPLIHMLGAGEFDLGRFLTWIVALALAITIHEFGHAYRAEKAGDPTPRAHGRVSLYPWDHYDPLGTTLILLFGLGWAKPVPTNPMNFRHPRRDEIMVSLWGPLSNIILAVLLAIPVRFALVPVEYAVPLVDIMYLNLLLAVFNLIPVWPLDGSHILSAILPVETARKLDQAYRQFGPMLLLVVFMIAGRLVWPVVDGLMYLLVGLNL